MARIEQPREIGTRPWRIVAASIGGLILAIVVAGIIAIVENERVKNVTERSLHHDVEIEDEGDDLRVAVLDLRHHHRDLVFYGPTESALTRFERAYADLMEEIGELERLRIDDPTVPQPAYIRGLAEEYYAAFQPAIALYSSDPQAFQIASVAGLRRIDEMDDAADEIDGLGERLAAAALARVHEATATEQITLIAVVGGVALIGIVLAVAAGRVLARLHASYAREQSTARDLERALRTKNDFISDASHELRTPLTVIRGNAEIGLGTVEARVQREILGEIWNEATRMSKLVDDLLFLARSDAGMPPLERELVPARWLVGRMTKPAEVLARQRSSCLAVELNGEGYLDVDPERIQQAALILVDNAARHAPEGTCVALAARAANGELAIEVADAGSGIPPEELQFIFDRFYRVGNRRARKKDGSGLGLSIAKTIVEAHGGTIEVDSCVNVGTRMTIRLPLCPTPESTAVPDRQLASA
jgi:signal transduction histidine kinase